MPFALYYLVDADGVLARLTSAVGLSPDAALRPQVIDRRATDPTRGWPIASVVRSNQCAQVDELAARVSKRFEAPAGEAQ